MSLQQLHRDEGLVTGVLDVVNGADMRMVQGGSGPCMTLEAFQRLRVTGQVLGQEL